MLLQVLASASRTWASTSHDVAELAAAVGRELGIDAEELDEVARAAELHDVGKVAIPDAILHKPGPLDEAEWGFMRRHTIIGERILARRRRCGPWRASCARATSAGTAGATRTASPATEIPLGARIVGVCDAFDAMTIDRALPPAHARRGRRSPSWSAARARSSTRAS